MSTTAENVPDNAQLDAWLDKKLDENHHRSTLGGWRFRGLPWEQC